jgi:transcription antitermination protein NusB
MARKRHLSRIAVMQTLFERDARGNCSLETLKRNATELEREYGTVDTVFATAIFDAYMNNQSIIHTEIEKRAPEWPLHRMDPIARAILYIGATEMLYISDAPAPVIINECIDMAKEYGGSEASKFVNGVLHALSFAK